MDFSLKIVSKAIEETGFHRNFACSPLSIAMMLNMIASGLKRGNYLDQYLAFLGSRSIDETIAESLKLMAVMANKNSSSTGGDGGGLQDSETVHENVYNSTASNNYYDPRFGGTPYPPFTPTAPNNSHYSVFGGSPFGFSDNAIPSDESSPSTGGGCGPELFMGNASFVDQSCSLKPSFEQVLTNTYEAEAGVVDFKHKDDEAIDEVNSWIENATKGLIKDFLPKNPSNKYLLIILVNALYFEGAWKHKFDASKSKDDTFYLLNGNSVTTRFMCQYNELHLYGSFDGFKLVKLPYQYGTDERRFSMFIFLPDEINGLQNLLNTINSDPVGFFNQKFELRNTTIHKLLIPNFSVSFTFDVAENMKKLGFNFSSLIENIDMVDTHGDDGGLVPVGIVHEACIKVNEEGTEAAAVTAFGGFGGSLYRPPPLNFIADHPFMFMIKEEASQTPFFIGVIINPKLQ